MTATPIPEMPQQSALDVLTVNLMRTGGLGKKQARHCANVALQTFEALAATGDVKDAQNEQIKKLCSLYLDDELGRYRASAIFTQIFAIAAIEAAPAIAMAVQS